LLKVQKTELLGLVLGAEDGFSDSWVDGDWDGIIDGTVDATPRGLGNSSQDRFKDGFSARIIDGSDDMVLLIGEELCTEEGSADGFVVGIDEGFDDGIKDGCWDGIMDGLDDSAPLGLELGDEDTSWAGLVWIAGWAANLDCMGAVSLQCNI
jgi:hypothetical protein